MAHTSQYSDTTLDEMQLLYGEGYLSPGGAEEVDAILDGVAVRGRRVLDLGCGVGGAAIRIVRELDAGTVVGIDVEEDALERATAAVSILDFRVSPPLGPFPAGDRKRTSWPFPGTACRDLKSSLLGRNTSPGTGERSVCQYPPGAPSCR